MADPESVARSIGLDLLTATPKTRSQLAQAMRKRGVPDEAAAEVLDRFDEVGLIDDAAFATAWVRSRQAGKGLAPRVLANELRQRGVAESLIADAVAGIDHDDIDSAARALVKRRARTTSGLPIQVRLRRLTAMLGRKGYAGDVALRIVREVLADEGTDTGDLPESADSADLADA
ncbi:MAG: regulatory protein [Actinomycetota bacterium]|jgi:regulatory protein|nr:regulatory protein [Actinomycetota bacterium]